MNYATRPPLGSSSPSPRANSHLQPLHMLSERLSLKCLWTIHLHTQNRSLIERCFQHASRGRAESSCLAAMLPLLWLELFRSFFMRFCYCDFILLGCQGPEWSKYVSSWKFPKISLKATFRLALFRSYESFPVFTLGYLAIFEHLLSIEHDGNP